MRSSKKEKRKTWVICQTLADPLPPKKLGTPYSFPPLHPLCPTLHQAYTCHTIHIVPVATLEKQSQQLERHFKRPS